MMISWLSRITPIIALGTVIALLSTGVWMANYVDRANARQELDRREVQGHILAITAVTALSFNDRQIAQEYVNAIRANPQIEAAGIYDATGKLFVGYHSGPAIPLPTTVKAGPPMYRDHQLAVTVPMRQDGVVIGTVYLRSPTEPLAIRMVRYGAIGLLTTMASVVVAVLSVAHLAQRRANEELARHAAQLAAANLALERQIAEREKIEEALRQSQKMEAIGQLTGGVAHDFNNLLQVILGNLQRLVRQPHTEDGNRMIAAATRAAGRAATLTQRLLAFARRQPLSPQSLDLNQLVTGMLEMFGRTLRETIQIEPMLANGLWRVFADENQMENALVNLAVNARDAMPNGGRLILQTRNVRFRYRLC